MTGDNSPSGSPNINVKAPARHALAYRVQHRVRTGIVMTIVALLVFMGTAATAVWVDISNTIKQGEVKVLAQKNTKTNAPDSPLAHEPVNVLILGQDTREGEGNAAIGGRSAHLQNNHQADTSMVMQISADRSWINLVSIPRDSLVSVPSCETSQGSVSARNGAMFNSIFAEAYLVGGDLASAASCTLSAVNYLTGLNIQNFVVVDFQGLSSMIDAIGGVDICIPVDTKDRTTKLDLKRGLQHLNGTQATQYARMRKGTGTDGSDIMRTTRQQYLIKQLLNEALNKNLLTQSSQLYQLAKSALQSLNISEGLADATTLAQLAMSLADFDLDNLYTQTVPVTPAPSDPNRVVWAAKAEDVWAKMRANQPLTKETAKQSGKDSKSTSDGSSDTTNGSTDGTGNTGDGQTGDTSGTQTSEPKPDSKTGLITQPDGTLIDPKTGGIVNPQDGSIRDTETGQYIGIANKYLYATVCAVPES